MRFSKIALDLATLLTVFFLFVISILFFLQFGFEGQFFINSNSTFYLILALSALGLGTLLTFFFVLVHKKSVLVVRFQPQKIDVDVDVIKGYIEKKFSFLSMSCKEIDVEVDRLNKIHIHAKVEKMPEMHELGHLEKEIGQLLVSKLGYAKDYQVYFLKG